MRNTVRVFAITGVALIALSLTGSVPSAANLSKSQPDPVRLKLLAEQSLAATRDFNAGKFDEARRLWREAADSARKAGALRQAATYLSNAGGASLARKEYREALRDFAAAKQIASGLENREPLAYALTNLSSLYQQMGNSEACVRVAREALAIPGKVAVRRQLQVLLATGLASGGRFPEAEPIYREAIAQLYDAGDFENTARTLGSLGNQYLEAGQLERAEAVLTEALRIDRMHHLATSANILSRLARLRARQGDARSAAALFDAAIAAPQSLTPMWMIYADRGEFRLSRDETEAALSDFRKARDLAREMRAGVVPADSDRVALETGLSRVVAGLVDSGNRLALKLSRRELVEESFNVSEEDRLWSLRALLPLPNDWRTRLPAHYWDTLSNYQTAERKMLAKPSEELRKQTEAMRGQLEEMEEQAGAGNSAQATSLSAVAGTSLRRVQSLLLRPGHAGSEDSRVLFSFQISERSGWVWVMDARNFAVFPIPSLAPLKVAVARYAHAVKSGDPAADALGRALYKDLFGKIPASFTSHGRWLLELDGPLFELPFSTLQVDDHYLLEKAALQVVPSGLMLEAAGAPAGGGFLGVGDPVYNAADERYAGERRKQEIALPRLAATGSELDQCARSWGASNARLLTGNEASLENVRAALLGNPAVIHFATHVVTAPGDYASGLIALSLDHSGALGLLGPAEIVAHPVKVGLVVLNGCHSGQAEALPAAGLMGLTRAWLGAGAGAVLATRWDIPDEAGNLLMVEFYRTLRKLPERGPAAALRAAQLHLLQSDESRRSAAVWGAYFVMARG